MPNPSLSLVWMRRDLRLHDHAALSHALAGAGQVQPVFVFDTEVLARFSDPDDRRLTFIAQTICTIDAQLRQRGGGLLVLYGKASEVMGKLSQMLAAPLFAAQDFEPATQARDALVSKTATLTLVKDHLIFAPNEIIKSDGTAFKVFTPYAKQWRAALTPQHYAEYPIEDAERYADIAEISTRTHKAGFTLLDPRQGAAVMLAQIGYREVDNQWPVKNIPESFQLFINQKLRSYAVARDMVAEAGTSRISPYLRFGLVSIRECLRAALAAHVGEKWISELIWREFYAMILWHYPHSTAHEWNNIYDGALDWSRNEEHLAAWKTGKTGYPLVDAAMRQLRDTGWMHNRARMVVASFLTKDLQIDWRLGEEHFAQYLMDYELASNVGGWQWAASTGTDAQPWFRIFNPILQSQKFDPRGEYIRTFVPELRGLNDSAIHEPWRFKRPLDYPLPIVDHAQAREKTLAMFKAVKAPVTP